MGDRWRGNPSEENHQLTRFNEDSGLLFLLLAGLTRWGSETGDLWMAIRSWTLQLYLQLDNDNSYLGRKIY